MLGGLFRRGPQASAGGDRSVFGNFWFEPLGMRSSTGLRVTAGSAMRLSAVYACVRVLAESFAILPFRMYKRKTDGGRDLVTDHWLFQLMKHPNAWQTPFEWREMLMGHLCLRGNAFCQIVADGRGQIQQLVPIHPDRIKLELLDSGSYRYQVTTLDGKTQILPRGEVWHIRGLSSDGLVGLNPMEMAAEVIGVGLAAQGFGARFFANDARPAGWIEFDGKFTDVEHKKAFRESWQSSQGGSNRGKTAVLEKGFKYHELGINNSDNQFLELFKHTRSEIAGIFRVPPHKIGDLDRATFTNIEQQSLDFINDGMLPWTERWESSMETFLLEDDSEFEIEFDFSNLLRGDMAARSAYYTSNINNGSMTRNEARIAEGRNPLPGLDKPLQPLNMVPVGESPPEPPKVPAKPDPAAGRLGALASSAAERVARKEGEMVAKAGDRAALVAAYAKHAVFVANALSVSADDARAYCALQVAMIDAEPGIEAETVGDVARSRLEDLALGGKPAAVDLGANAMHRLASSIASQAAPVINVAAPDVNVAAPVVHNHLAAPEVNVAAPVVNVTTPEPQVSVQVAAPEVHVTTPEPQVTVNVAAPEVSVTNQAAAAPNVSVNVAAPEAKQDKPWATRTTIKKRDSEGRADVIETTPID